MFSEQNNALCVHVFLCICAKIDIHLVALSASSLLVVAPLSVKDI